MTVHPTVSTAWAERTPTARSVPLPATPRHWLTIAEMAARTGLGKTHLAHLCRSGQIPCRKEDGLLRPGVRGLCWVIDPQAVATLRDPAGLPRAHYSLAQAARRIGIGDEALLRAIRAGDVPATFVGCRWQIASEVAERERRLREPAYQSDLIERVITIQQTHGWIDAAMGALLGLSNAHWCRLRTGTMPPGVRLCRRIEAWLQATDNGRTAVCPTGYERRRHLRRWTAAEERVAVTMAREGWSFAQIGERVGRPASSVGARLYRLGVILPRERCGE